MDSLFINPARRSHAATGYWGKPDALHQFCEPHYA